MSIHAHTKFDPQTYMHSCKLCKIKQHELDGCTDANEFFFFPPTLSPPFFCVRELSEYTTHTSAQRLLTSAPKYPPASCVMSCICWLLSACSSFRSSLVIRPASFAVVLADARPAAFLALASYVVVHSRSASRHDEAAGQAAGRMPCSLVMPACTP
jgi:hypothetical protein